MFIYQYMHSLKFLNDPSKHIIGVECTILLGPYITVYRKIHFPGPCSTGVTNGAKTLHAYLRYNVYIVNTFRIFYIMAGELITQTYYLPKSVSQAIDMHG